MSTLVLYGFKDMKSYKHAVFATRGFIKDFILVNSMSNKTAFIMLRVDKNQHARMKYLAETKGINLSEYIRSKVQDEDYQIDTKLTRIMQKLDELTKLVSKQ